MDISSKLGCIKTIFPQLSEKGQRYLQNIAEMLSRIQYEGYPWDEKELGALSRLWQDEAMAFTGINGINRAGKP